MHINGDPKVNLQSPMSARLLDGIMCTFLIRSEWCFADTVMCVLHSSNRPCIAPFLGRLRRSHVSRAIPNNWVNWPWLKKRHRSYVERPSPRKSSRYHVDFGFHRDAFTSYCHFPYFAMLYPIMSTLAKLSRNRREPYGTNGSDRWALSYCWLGGEIIIREFSGAI